LSALDREVGEPEAEAEAEAEAEEVVDVEEAAEEGAGSVAKLLVFPPWLGGFPELSLRVNEAAVRSLPSRTLYWYCATLGRTDMARSELDGTTRFIAALHTRPSAPALKRVRAGQESPPSIIVPVLDACYVFSG
jgi:hypothetical protein